MTSSDDGFRDRLARALEDDLEAQEVLLAAAAERVLTFCRARLGGLRAELEPLDLVQECFASALADLAGFRGTDERAFERWLCAIAENRLRDLAKGQRTIKRTPPGRVQPASVLLERARLSATGPATHVERAERAERLHQALAALDEDERAALLARHFRGETLERVAAELGRSESAVRRLIGRASAKLGRQLGAEEAR